MSNRPIEVETKPVVSTLLRQEFLPDYSEALELIDDSESRARGDAIFALASVAVGVAATCGIVATATISWPIALPVVGGLSCLISAWNSRQTEMDRARESEFLSDFPQVLTLIESKVEEGVSESKIAAAYEQMFKSYRYGELSDLDKFIPGATGADSLANIPIDDSPIVDDVAAAQTAPPSAAEPKETAPSSAPVAMPTPGFIAQMGHNVKAALVVGIPGSGKGLTTANLVDEVRKRRPELSIAGLDPKNSPKEAGYFLNRYDHLQRFKMNPRDIDSTIAEVRKFMNAVDLMGDDTLAVIDEAATLFDTLKLEKDFYAVFIRWLALIVQQGNSEGKYVWLLSQTGNLSELGIPPSLRSSLDLLAIAPAGSDAMLQGLLRTDLIPQGRQSSIQTARAAIERSEVERAYYFSREGQWQPMPSLPNPSGYNRDKRQWVKGHVPAEPTSEATEFDAGAIDRMAGHSFKVEETIEVKSEAVEVTPKAELLRYLGAVQAPKRVKEIRTGAKPPIKQMKSEDIRLLLDELIQSGEIKTDGTRFFI
jgi:hypothetical protein